MKFVNTNNLHFIDASPLPSLSQDLQSSNQSSFMLLQWYYTHLKIVVVTKACSSSGCAQGHAINICSTRENSPLWLRSSTSPLQLCCGTWYSITWYSIYRSHHSGLQLISTSFFTVQYNCGIPGNKEAFGKLSCSIYVLCFADSLYFRLLLLPSFVIFGESSLVKLDTWKVF